LSRLGGPLCGDGASFAPSQLSFVASFAPSASMPRPEPTVVNKRKGKALIVRPHTGGHGGKLRPEPTVIPTQKQREAASACGRRTSHAWSRRRIPAKASATASRPHRGRRCAVAELGGASAAGTPRPAGGACGGAQRFDQSGSCGPARRGHPVGALVAFAGAAVRWQNSAVPRRRAHLALRAERAAGAAPRANCRQ